MAGENEDTPGRLIAAARDLFLESGPSHFSLREVARRVGVSAPAIYRHFEGKDELLAAACERGFQVFSSYLVRALSEPTPLARMKASRDQYLLFGLHNVRDYRFIFMSPANAIAPGGSRAKREFMVMGTSPTFQFLVDRVKECMAARIISKRDPEAAAADIWAHVHGLVSLRLSGHLDVIGSDAEFTKFYCRSTDDLFAALA